ncbi:MAG: polysaccharide biosynthesis C-terminal domain-containing protein [Flavobacteriales bacterium]|nr:polysaccharide biosynthesis C-terminal domain-containing protein [Flavobacteriales bacterium]
MSRDHEKRIFAGGLKAIPKKIMARFNSGHQRSAKAKKNIALSLLFRGINIAIGFLLVPLILGYIGQLQYGIWLTLASLILWFNFFDVGLGHGLRNKLGEALAKGNTELGRRYVSTAYAAIFGISVFIFLLGFLIHQFLDWSVLLGVPDQSRSELGNLAIIVFGFFTARLFLNLLISIILADQQPATRDLINVISRVVALSVLYGLTLTTSGSLLYVGIVVSMAPVIVLLVFTLVLFRTRYRHLAPKISQIDRSLFSDLMNIGGRFFILQIAAVVLYSTDNMIIAHLFSPAQVTPYHIAAQYFGIALIGFSIIISPLWSAATDAYAQNDMRWIRNTVAKLYKVWMLTAVGLGLLLTVSAWVYDLWLSGTVVIPFALSAVWAIFVATQTFSMIFVQVINGMGKIRLPMIIGVSSAVLNVPLSIFFARNMGMGIVGVITATLVTQVVGLFFMATQYQKLTSGKAHGIWAK